MLINRRKTLKFPLFPLFGFKRFEYKEWELRAFLLIARARNSHKEQLNTL